MLLLQWKTARTLLARCLTGASLFILTYFVAFTQGLESAGFVNLVWLLLLLLSLLAKYGIEYSGVKQFAVAASTCDHALAGAFINAASGVLLLLLLGGIPLFLYAGSQLFASYGVRTAELALFTLILPVYGTLAFIAPLHRGLSRPDASYYFDQGGVAMLLIILLAGFQFTRFISGFLLSLLGATVVVCCWSWLVLQQRYRSLFARRLILHPSPSFAALREGLPYFVISVAEYFLFWIGLLLLAVFDNHTNVGIYAVLIRTVQLSVVAMGIINAIISPTLATLQAQHKTWQLRCYLVKVWKLNFMLGVLSLLTVGLLAPLALQTANITPSRNIIMVFVLLLLPQLTKILLGPAGQIMAMSCNSQHTLAIFALGSLLTAAVLALLLIPLHGMPGAALSYCVGLSSYHVFCVFEIRKRQGFYTFEAGSRFLKKLVFVGQK